MNELLIYGDINSYTSAEFIRGFAEIVEGPLTVRVNSGGGSPIYGYGMINKFRSYEGEKTVIIDGVAHSTAGFFVLFAKNTEAIQQAKFVIHRAAYPSWYEEMMSQAEIDSLNSFNEDIYQAFKAKIDVAKFEEITGQKLKAIFSMDGRIEVELNAKQAKQIGLISKIVSLTPEMQSDIKMRVDRLNVKLAANSGSAIVPEIESVEDMEQEKKPKQANTIKMITIEKLQAENPGLYAEIIAKGVTQGVEQEKDRVAAWMAWQGVDAVRVKEGIDSGKTVSMTDISEFNLSAMKNGYIETLKAEADKTGAEKIPGTAAAEEIIVDAKQSQIDALTASIMGRKPEIK